MSRTVEELDLFYPELLEEVLEQLDQLDSDERQLAISLMDDHNPLDAIAGVRVAALPAR